MLLGGDPFCCVINAIDIAILKELFKLGAKPSLQLSGIAGARKRNAEMGKKKKEE